LDFGLMLTWCVCIGQAEDMVDFYLNNASDMKSLCPPKKPAAASSGSGSSGSGSSGSGGGGESKVTQKQMAEAKDIVLSCGTVASPWRVLTSAPEGHVEGNLNPSAIGEILTLLELVSAGACELSTHPLQSTSDVEFSASVAGAIYPSHVEQGYGEYATEKYTICMPVKKGTLT
jgi:hypothetical protein